MSKLLVCRYKFLFAGVGVFRRRSQIIIFENLKPELEFVLSFVTFYRSEQRVYVYNRNTTIVVVDKVWSLMWGLPFIENVRLKSFCKKSEMISLDRFLMYLLLDGILSIGGLSTALVAPPILLSCSATQIHTKGRRYQRLTLISTAADSIELSHYKPVDKLEQMCNACARKSNLHPNGESADWINVNSLAEISMSLNDTCLLAASTFGSFLLSSPLPAKSVIFEGSNYILSLLTVPSGMVVPLKNTDPSSILLYKPLRGFGELSTITDKGTIIDKVDGNNEFNTINHDVFQKKGGFLRQFSSRDTGAGSSIFLELEFTRRRFQGLSLSLLYCPLSYAALTFIFCLIVCFFLTHLDS